MGSIPVGDERDDGSDRMVFDSLLSELERCDERIASLRTTAATFIQLSVVALVAGIAALNTAPVGFAVAPPIITIWLLYLAALDRETKKHATHREWLEDHLNVLVTASRPVRESRLAVRPFQWQQTVEVVSSYSPPTMLFGLYGLLGVAYVIGWTVGAGVLHSQLEDGGPSVLRSHPTVWTTSYLVVGLGLLASLIVGVATTRRLQAAAARALYADRPLPRRVPPEED